ncbi:MAG: Cob(I)yrinic acid a,c-diamide adenosyltransferase [Alphaproteobacteria bacterium MarineAlpha11_Bin1]|mgnify:CR=1 FL=1|nr:MAG: Cob(I)yrinic acid a,c-diamide adenosyltransferase [Alphaproteobacteria bacterium MarineAlpha11_Bin1]
MAAAVEHRLDLSQRSEGSGLMAKKPQTTEEFTLANEKSKKRKEARDKMLANKTVEKGLLIVHTGKGKGKSTAAFGVAARAVGNGMKVGVIQYVKGKWETGERTVLEHFPEQVTIRTMGEGFTWETQDKARDIAAAEKAWKASKEIIADPSYDLVILDELNIVLRYDYLDLTEVLEVLVNKREMLHVIVTGRNAKPELVAAADLVTEMTQIKHPFREQNVRAQKGIEF